ncbi:beta strand repeat-containing protein, partial [Spirosoma arcticum]
MITILPSLFASKKLSFWHKSGIGTLLIVLVSLTSIQAQVSGTVFRDFSANGVQDTPISSTAVTPGEPGVAGIVVTAFPVTGAPVSVTTNINGSYTFTAAQVPSGIAVRLELGTLVTGTFSGPVSTTAGGSGTTIRFVTAGGAATGVNFGINYPTDYCQAIPNFIVPCYVNGNPTGAGTSPGEPVLVTLPYNATSPTGSGGNTTAESGIATNGQVGTVYGVAYQRVSRLLFTSAFVKRHSGLGRNTTTAAGNIYITNPASTTSTLFTNIPDAGTVATNTARGLPGNVVDQNRDPLVYDQVGKTGLGDLEISDDGTELFVVNLNNRRLYRIPIINANTANPTPGTSTTITIPSPATQAPGSVFRPMALKYYRGRLYVGGVTTNEATSTTTTFPATTTAGTSSTPGNLITRDTAQLKAVVFEFNPTTSSFNPTPVLSFPLTYKRGAINNDKVGIDRAEYWLPWTDIEPGFGTNPIPSRFARADDPNTSYPQAWFSGIEFDVDGSMIVSIRDRTGDQWGNSNLSPNTSQTRLYRTNAAGDILRAGKCDAAINLWTIESNARICGRTPTSGAGNTQGPGGGEYYFGDAIQQGPPFHIEMSDGALALIPGRGEVASIALDPTFDLQAGGIRRFNNTTGIGTPATSVQIYVSGNVATFGKANGLGDLELTCNPAPIEIGNRVFRDNNDNGIQDPGEPGIAGVAVTLRGTGLATGGVSVTTNAQGEYYFSNSAGPAGTGFAYSLTALSPGNSYTLTFPTSVSTSAISAKPDFAANSADNIDTDASTAGVISFTLGQAGENNHTFDVGFVDCSLSATLTAGIGSTISNTVCAGQPVTLTTLVSPTGSYTYAVSGPAGVTLTGATTATATATGLPTGLNTFTVTVSSSPVCVTTATVSVSVVALPTAALSSATICAGASTVLTTTSTGATSFTLLGGAAPVINATGSFTVTPAVSTTYTVRVGNPTGCTATAVGSVSVVALPTATLSSATICAGASAVLTTTSTGGTSFTLLGGAVPVINATGSFTVTPAASTTYTVRVGNPTGCTATAVGSVSVVALPTAALSSATICAGASAVLTTTFTGGANSFTLLGGATPVVNATGSFTVTPAVSTTYTVRVSNPTGCTATAVGSVSVVALPTATLSSATICAGASAVLTTTFTGGANSFTLLGGATPVVNATGSFTVTPAVSTTYTVQVSNPTGCTATAVGSVSVVALPTATLSSATICAGASTVLTTTFTGGANSFTLLGGATPVVNATGSFTVTPTVSTTYTVRVTNATGCTATATGAVTVNPAPSVTLTASSVAVCVGQAVTLNTQVSAGSSFTVSAPAGVTLTGATTTNATTSTLTTGVKTFTVTASNEFGCVSTTTVSVSVNTSNGLVSLAPSLSAICLGQSTALNVSVLGLNVQVGSPIFSAVGPGGILTMVTGTVSPTATTSFIASVNILGIGIVNTCPTTVTVVTLPSVAPISISLCVGATVGLPALLTAVPSLSLL